MANSGSGRPARRRPEQPPRKQSNSRPAQRSAPQRRPPQRSGGTPRRRKRSGVLLRLLTMFIIVAVFLVGVAIFFKVTDVQVTGSSLYSAEEVVRASGVEEGDNMMTLNKARAVGKIMAVLPYIETARISRVLPGTVVIDVTESDAAYAVAADDGTSWLINSSGKVLEQAAVSAADYPKLTGVTARSPEVGQPVASEQTENLAAAMTVLEQLETTDFISRIAEINVEKTYDIVLWYEDLYEIRLGGSDEMAYKIQYLVAVLDQLDGEQGGVIDLTFEEKKVASFKPWQNSQELTPDSVEKSPENS